jgi:hypothetical protein
MTSPISNYRRNIIRKHACKRCRQRIGIKLTRKLERQIVSTIKKGGDRCKLIEGKTKKDSTREVLDVDLFGQIIRVVYDKEIDQIVTVLNRNPKSDFRD